MWDNIGEKIKTLAKVIAFVGIISSIIGGISLISQGIGINQRNWSSSGGELSIFLGIASLIGGSIISWISSFFMYGFGELIEVTSEIKKHIYGEKNNPDNNDVTGADVNISEKKMFYMP